jgi:hypothetical protein
LKQAGFDIEYRTYYPKVISVIYKPAKLSRQGRKGYILIETNKSLKLRINRNIFSGIIFQNPAEIFLQEYIGVKREEAISAPKTAFCAGY